LWAAATLGITDAKVIARLSEACDRESGDFNAQEAANSLWAAAAIKIVEPKILGELSRAALRFVDHKMDPLCCRQILQAIHLQDSASEGHKLLHSLFSGKHLHILDSQLAAHPEPPRTSSLQRRVYKALESQGVDNLKMEHLILNGLLPVDIYCTKQGKDGNHKQIDIAIEVDGPSHFHRNSNTPTTATLLRNRLILNAGLRLLVIPYKEWNAAEKKGTTSSYLQSLLATI
jgi:hypothetical protein